jgi:hypothetical protein
MTYLPVESFIIQRLQEGGWRVIRRRANLTNLPIGNFVSLRDAEEWVNCRRLKPSPARPAGGCESRRAAIAAITSVHWPSAWKWNAKEVRIMGSKSVLLRTLVAASSAKSAGFGVPSFAPKWRAIQNKTANSYVIEIIM